MKYNLEIRSSDKSKRIFLPIFSTYPRCFGHFEAVLDTGSPRTVLSARDAIRLNIPFKNLQTTDPIKGYGKGGCPALKINKFSMRIKAEGNKSKAIEFPISVVDFPQLNKTSEDTKRNSIRMPTLLGLDFLEKNKFSLFIDLINNIAYLEDKE